MLGLATFEIVKYVRPVGTQTHSLLCPEWSSHKKRLKTLRGMEYCIGPISHS